MAKLFTKIAGWEGDRPSVRLVTIGAIAHLIVFI